MKKLLRIAASLILVVCICTNTMITSFANNNNDSSVSDFPYDNASNYVADCISKGIINMDGTATSTPYVSLAILHEYTYQNLAEALIDDPLLTFDSAFWKNIGLVLDADFTNCVNWQKNLYIALIMDYLNYSEKDDAYKSNLDKKTQEFSEEITKQVFEYADSEYLKNVDDLIENQSLTDAVNFSNKYGYINEINEYNTLADDINKVSKSAFEYYENLSKALAVQSVNKSRIEFLEQMKEAGSDNKYFVEAIDEVISAYEATFSKIAFSEGCSTMLDFAVKECFGFLENSIPELKLIFKGLKVYTSGLDWLFNSDDISDNNLKILLLYTMGSYTFTALNSLRDTYASNPTTENAEAFIGGFFSFLKYHEYATSNTYGFISSTIFDGISNNIKNIFLNENQVKYETFKEYLDYDIKFSQKVKEMVNNLYSIYFSIINFDVGEGENSSDNPSSAEKPGMKDTAFARYVAAVAKTTESGSWSEQLALEADMSIDYEGGKTKTKMTMNIDSDISNYIEDDLSQIEISASTNMKIMEQNYVWSTEYKDGIAHHQFTEPVQESQSVEIDPNFFDFYSISYESIISEEISGNQIRFIVSGEKITETGIAAVKQISGINNFDSLKYGDMEVIVTINNRGSIDQTLLNFDLSMEYQGYDADVTYKIQYKFL